MITELAKILPKFSEVGHTQCFLHIVNLVAKSIIRQFNIPKKQDDGHLDKVEQELCNLAGNINLENKEAKELMAQCQIDGEIHMEDERDNNVEGWVDEVTLLSPSECECIEEDI